MSPCRLAFTLLIALTLWGCSQGGDRAVYLDRAFASPCEAFKAIGHFSLELHLEKTEKDWDSLVNASMETVEKKWDLPPSTATNDFCAQLQDLSAQLQEKDPSLDNEMERFREILKHFLSQLDAHSSYLTPEEAERYLASREKKRFGIGVALRQRLVDRWALPKKVVIEQVFSGSPSEGVLQPGDEIEEINGRALAGMSFPEILNILGNTSTLEIKIPRLERPVSLAAAWHTTSPVLAQVIDADDLRLAYIKIRSFPTGLGQEIEELIESLEADEGIDGYLLDLRNNGGGAIDEATQVVGLFRGKGPVIFSRATKTKQARARKYGWNLIKTERSTRETPLTSKPMLGLTDPGSASSAEIVMGALKVDRTVWVGERSFGKGVGQVILPLSDKNGFGGLLLLVAFRTYFPNGFGHQKLGIQPHFILRDRELEEVVKLRQAKGLKTILHEEDFGDLAISSATRVEEIPSTRDFQKVLSWLRNRVQEQSYAKTCLSPEAADDCQKAVGLAMLRDLSRESF